MYWVYCSLSVLIFALIPKYSNEKHCNGRVRITNRGLITNLVKICREARQTKCYDKDFYLILSLTVIMTYLLLSPQLPNLMNLYFI